MIEVTLPEDQSVGLTVVEKMTPEKLFAQGGTKPVLEAIKKEVDGFVGDVSTEAGRKEIASLAYKIARSKTFIDKIGEVYNADMKKVTKAIDVERKALRDALEELQAEVRKPLTEWEEKEKARQQGHKDALALIEATAKFDTIPTTQEVRQRIADLEQLSARDFEENAEFAAVVMKESLEVLEAHLAACEAADAERAELEALRAAKAEQDAKDAEQRRKEEEEKLKAKLAEDARIKAEEDAKKAVREAEERARRAEEAAKEAAEKAERDRKEAEAKAVREAEKAEADKQAAIKAEQDRQKAEQEAEAAAQALREKDRAHKGQYNRSAAGAIEAFGGITSEQAKKIVEAIAKGHVPHVKILY